MRVSFICGEAKEGWIYSRFIEAFQKYSRHEIVINKRKGVDLLYFLPYYEYGQTDIPSVAWFSHQEQSEPLRGRFISVAKKVDFCISHSLKYANILRESGVKNVTNVIPGVDTNFFKPGEFSDGAFRVGYCGRMYQSSSRKNPKLLKQLSNLDSVIFYATNGKISYDKLPEFYNSVDLIVQPGLVEGGSMAVQEALACGRPIVVFRGVGVEKEFKTGLLRVKYGDEKAFIRRVKDFGAKRREFSKPEVVEKMRSQVLGQTWERFVEKQDEIFKVVLDGK